MYLGPKEAVLVDYWKYRKPLGQKVTAKYVPPFDENEVRRIIGESEVLI